MAKLIINFFALLMIINVRMVYTGLPKAEAQTCVKGEAQEGVCVKVDGPTLCDLLCKASNTTWFGK
ncbi:unnamed protein product [Arabidopsis halleri]